MGSTTPQPNEDFPSYLRIADVLRQRVIEGAYVSGAPLPTQEALAREFVVSRDTVKSVLEILRNEGLSEGVLAPRSIAVRLLLPSPDGRYGLPVAIDDPSDERPLSRLLDLVRSYAVVLEGQFQTLAGSELVPSVSVDIRVLRLEPSFKLCIANGQDALYGLYLLATNDIPDGRSDVPERIRTYDYQGPDKDVFSCVRDNGHARTRDGAMFDQLRQWFDTRWETIARPFPRSY